jgi:hypothetical protein
MIRRNAATSMSEATRSLRPDASSISVVAGLTGGAGTAAGGVSIETGKN